MVFIVLIRKLRYEIELKWFIGKLVCWYKVLLYKWKVLMYVNVVCFKVRGDCSCSLKLWWMCELNYVYEMNLLVWNVRIS